MNILILGGTGNISSEVAACLVDCGDKVTVLTSGKRPVPKRYTHIKADRHDRASLQNALNGKTFDSVIDFLGYTVEHCRIAHDILDGKTGQFVFISSATVYQKPPPKLPLTEDTPLCNPFWEYGRRKIACEEYLRHEAGRGFPLTIVRPSHTFGHTWIPSPLHGADWTVAGRMLAGKPVILHDNGESLWTLTASSDFAQGIYGIICNEKALGKAVHITSDEALTWNAIYKEIGKALGVTPEIVHIPADFLARHIPGAGDKLWGDKARNSVFDNTKIRRLNPGWSCRKTFARAIRESVAWYYEDESRKKVDPEKDREIERVIRSWSDGVAEPG
ncbi:MAG: NAD-dependent epimerase/dehydratase family protein [Chitinivibrionales bacterium]|nr:NAD-dependent epimerase/dehydratase family protein [Chitinivibrionales bacterium]MBD3397318.1 NAD-dependent epimerase/dehydratase family protein [Chitinivibrionales bacterium]